VHPRQASHATALAALTAAAATAVLATTAVPAQAAWTTPQTLARPAAEQLAATGNAGRAELFAWKVTTKRRVRTTAGTGLASFVRARVRRTTGGLADARTLSSSKELVANPAVALDAAGNATVVWTQAGRTIRIMGAHRRNGASFGLPFEIGRTTAFNGAQPAIAVASDGAATVVWNGGRRIEVARRPAGRCRGAGRPQGCFGEPQPLTRGTDHAIAMSRGGSAFVMWAATVRRSGGSGSALRLAIAPRGELFGPSRAIPSPGEASQPSIAIAPNGSVIMAWRGSLPTGGEQNVDAPIVASTRTGAGVLSASQVVSALPGSDPQVHTTPQGRTILGWNQRNPTPQNPDGPEVAVSLGPAPGGGFAPPVRLSPAGIAAGSVSLAVDTAGSTTAVYSAALPPPLTTPPIGVAQVMAPGAGFGAPQALGLNFSGASVFAAGARVTAVSGGSDGRTLISDLVG
jgi:hypothetical protein